MRHLTLVVFVVLAVPMTLLTLAVVSDVALEASQRFALVVAVVVLAAASAWIISAA